MEATSDLVRIGELSRRTGVSRELLRAWEHRYGVLQPLRSGGGFRLYSPHDEQRVATMRAHVDRGLSAAEAARLTLEQDDRGRLAPESRGGADAGTPALERGARDLRAALDALDGSGAHAALDQLLAEFSLQAVLRGVVLPYLRDLGERWERGQVSVAQEHFASQVLRGRLLGLARGWDRGGGPRALLACPPEEQHDLGLIAFGLALREHGWRVTYLGPDTPLDTLIATATTLEPAAIVLAATVPTRFTAGREALRRLGRKMPVWAAGPGATPDFARATGAGILDADPLTAADRLAAATR